MIQPEKKALNMLKNLSWKFCEIKIWYLIC